MWISASPTREITKLHSRNQCRHWCEKLQRLPQAFVLAKLSRLMLDPVFISASSNSYPNTDGRSAHGSKGDDDSNAPPVPPFVLPYSLTLVKLKFSAFMHDLRGFSASKSRDLVEKAFGESVGACRGEKVSRRLGSPRAPRLFTFGCPTGMYVAYFGFSPVGMLGRDV